MDDGCSRWLTEAERYVSDCHAAATCVRASELALRMNVTQARLAREFHASVGICVKDYFMARQIERAQELLRTTKRGTAEIATETDIRVLPPPEFLNGCTAAAAVAGRTRARFDRRIPRPGTLLKREYRGDTIAVTVLADGFQYQGRHYGSLSAIATEVTGTRWNGVAFFGLTRTRRSTQGRGHV